jgi:glycerophosphoryl diester phosphodiesterase
MLGFAHRGGMAHGRGNELATFVQALELGATGLESDAWVTADGVVVLDHSGVVTLGGSRRSPIANVRRDQLPAHIPTLDELYARCGTDFEFAIDVKDAGVAHHVVDVAARHGAAHRLWLFAHEGVALGDVGPAHAAVTIYARQLRIGDWKARIGAERDLGMKAINSRWMWWNRALIDAVHEAGMLAFGYDAQRTSSLRYCVSLGLDGVFSNHVERMNAVLPPLAG